MVDSEPMNDRSETHTMAGLLSKALDLLKGRSFIEMLLMLILVAVGAGGYWIGNTVMPEQTKQIQEGYERINKENAERNTERMRYQEDKHAEAAKVYNEGLLRAIQAFESSSNQSSRREEMLMKAILDERDEAKQKERE